MPTLSPFDIAPMVSGLKVSPAATNSPALAHHLMRCAVSLFARLPAELSPAELQRAKTKALKSFELESRVLASSEAARASISEREIDNAVETIRQRFSSRDEYLQELTRNGLSEPEQRRALHRELIFDAVMEHLGHNVDRVSDREIDDYYHQHRDRFETPERRDARHILITVNDNFADNSRDQARQRIEEIRQMITNGTLDFEQLAQRYSECPTAMEGGKIGRVDAGKLYPALDRALFSLAAGELAGPLESEMGFHLLLCESIIPAETIPLERVRERIATLLKAQRVRARQKAWLTSLTRRSEQ